jgi:hypothetical protein
MNTTERRSRRRPVNGYPEVILWDPCPSHPGYEGIDTAGRSPSHELMPKEMRCVCCGAPVSPVTCNGCGRFLSCDEIHAHETRCDNCA